MRLLTLWPFSLYQTILLSITSYASYYVYWQLTTGAQRRLFRKIHKCKAPKKWRSYDPVFGLDFIYGLYRSVSAHTVLSDMQKRFEVTNAHTISFGSLIGSLIMTREPENCKAVLSTSFRDYSIGEQRKKVLIPFLGEGILETDGDKWHASREMLRPSFNKTQIGDLPMFGSHAQNLLKNIPYDGKTIDLQPLFFQFTLDVASEFLFGESVFTLSPAESNPQAAEFVRAFTYCNASLNAQDNDWGFLAIVMTNPRLKKKYKIVHDFVDSLIEKARANHDAYEKAKKYSTRCILIHELFDRTDNVATIRAESLNILLAGRDTTAALLSNTLFHLARNPAIYARLSTEIMAAFPATEPPSTIKELKSLKYLRALLNESLRLYPVIPENGREAIRNTVLPVGGGPDGKDPVMMKKGDFALWSVWAMHRRTDLYGEDAEEFRPERWLDGETEEGEKGLRVGWEYLPFNGGPRICLGQQLALMEASYVVVRLVQEFSSIESRDPDPWREKMMTTVSSLGGCKVALTPRG